MFGEFTKMLSESSDFENRPCARSDIFGHFWTLEEVKSLIEFSKSTWRKNVVST